jgi:hypothetical protein
MGLRSGVWRIVSLTCTTAYVQVEENTGGVKHHLYNCICTSRRKCWRSKKNTVNSNKKKWPFFGYQNTMD